MIQSFTRYNLSWFVVHYFVPTNAVSMATRYAGVHATRDITICFYFQTLIRIWDCFLAEGPKVLFRFSLAIIKINEQGILAKKDTINVMRHLKVCGKLMFDTDGLVEVR